jgi:hypothetical protein
MFSSKIKIIDGKKMVLEPLNKEELQTVYKFSKPNANDCDNLKLFDFNVEFPDCKGPLCIIGIRANEYINKYRSLKDNRLNNKWIALKIINNSKYYDKKYFTIFDIADNLLFYYLRMCYIMYKCFEIFSRYHHRFLIEKIQKYTEIFNRLKLDSISCMYKEPEDKTADVHCIKDLENYFDEKYNDKNYKNILIDFLNFYEEIMEEYKEKVEEKVKTFEYFNTSFCVHNYPDINSPFNFNYEPFMHDD